MLFPLIVTIALMLSGSPVLANDFDADGSSTFGRSLYDSTSSSSSDSGFEAMQRTWATEAQQAEQRNAERAVEMNQPQAEPTPSWVNPTPSFGVYGPGNTMQVCRQAGNSIYCF